MSVVYPTIRVTYLQERTVTGNAYNPEYYPDRLSIARRFWQSWSDDNPGARVVSISVDGELFDIEEVRLYNG